jgi:hypothetical protein
MKHAAIRQTGLRRVAAAATVAAIVGVPGGRSAEADLFMWNVGSGAFHVSGNWSPAGPPGINDDARFHRLTSPNTITFTNASDNPTNANLLITFGTFSFVSSGGPWTYTLTQNASVQSTSVLNLGTQTSNRMDLNAGSLAVRSGGTLNIGFGSRVTTNRLEIAYDSSTNGGTVVVDGVGSSLAVGEGGIHMGYHTATASLSFRNGATGHFDSPLRLVDWGLHSAKGYLSVLSGSHLTASYIMAGTNSSMWHEAFINVQGAGSRIVQTGASTLTVGSSALGVLDIGTISGGSGATFTTGTGMTAIGARGQINVGSAISSGVFNANGDILVDGGEMNVWPNQSQAFNWTAGRTMTIRNGGVVVLPLDDQHSLLPADAVINVTGAGSQLNGMGLSGLFLQENARVALTAGGAANYRNFSVGRAGSSGTLLVELPGSKFTTTGGFESESSIGANGGSGVVTFRVGGHGEFGSHPLYIGRRGAGGAEGGSGTLNLAPGGTIQSAGDVLVAHDPSTTGVINIQGAGAAMTQTGMAGLTIGAASGPAGAAKVNIGTTTSGATYTTGNGPVTILATGAVNIGSAATTGTFNVNGNMTIDGGQVIRHAGSLNLSAGRSLLIRGGGLMQSMTDQDFILPNNALVTVRDAGSRLLLNEDLRASVAIIEILAGASAVAGAFEIGAAAGPPAAGLLNILDGGTFNAGAATTVQATGRISIQGGTAFLGALHKQGGTLEFGHGSLSYIGDLDIGSGGLLGPDLTLPPNRHLALSGTATVEAGNALILAGGAFSAGTLLLSPGSRVVSTTGTAATAAVLGLTGSTIDARGGDLTIGDYSRVNGFYSNGTMLVGSRTLSLADGNDAVLGDAALVVLGAASDAGTLAAANGLTLNFGGNITGFGTINTPDNPATPFINNGNLTGYSSHQPLTVEGYVKGVGTFQNVVFAGTFSPGFSPAQVNLGNASYQGVLHVEIGGSSPGSGHDRLNHILGDGIANLGGTLAVSLINNYLPLPGQSFQIMTYSAHSGEFTGIVSHTGHAGLWFDAEYYEQSLHVRATALGGDANLDGQVDIADLGILAANWHQPGRNWLAGDFNGDGRVDIADLGILASNWQSGLTGDGSSSFAAAMAAFDRMLESTVPEPTALPLLGLAGLAALRRRRRQVLPACVSRRPIPPSRSSPGCGVYRHCSRG